MEILEIVLETVLRALRDPLWQGVGVIISILLILAQIHPERAKVFVSTSIVILIGGFIAHFFVGGNDKNPDRPDATPLPPTMIVPTLTPSPAPMTVPTLTPSPAPMTVPTLTPSPAPMIVPTLTSNPNPTLPVSGCDSTARDHTEPRLWLQEPNRMNGPKVEFLQRRLLELGYQLPTSGADGWFGPETEAAVKEFQRRNGLEVDGIVGPITWACLKNPNAARALD